jgi:hypothetical protein
MAKNGMMDKFIDAIKKELSWKEQKHPFFAHVPGWGCPDKEGVDVEWDAVFAANR